MSEYQAWRNGKRKIDEMEEEPQILVKREYKNVTIPTLQMEGDAGFDLVTLEGFTLGAGDQIILDTGLAFKIPKGYYGQIKSRSGLYFKHDISVFEGVIDSNYTGTIRIKVKNNNKEGSGDVRFSAGDRIAQILFLRVYTPLFIEVEELPDTNRGKKGFGSTGSGSQEVKPVRPRHKRVKTLSCVLTSDDEEQQSEKHAREDDEEKSTNDLD
jgi:dUTP pyrophosphatase